MSKYFSNPKLFFNQLLIVVGVFLLPGFASAQGGFVTCEGSGCSACNLVETGNLILVWLIGVAFVFFAVIAVVAGFGLVTSGGNPSALQAAKDKFVNAFIGLIIVLAAWVLVDTIMVALLKGTGGEIEGYGIWAEVDCQVQRAAETIEADHYYVDIGYASTATSTSATGTITTSGANCPVPPESAMVTIPGTSFKASPQTSANFVAMRNAAAADGITLTVTSGYRSEAKQVSIWVGKGCDANPANCSNRAARPCTRGGNGSNHNSGKALDISMNGQGASSPIYTWLKANGGRYGFYNNLDPNKDPFHWSPSGR